MVLIHCKIDQIHLNPFVDHYHLVQQMGLDELLPLHHLHQQLKQLFAVGNIISLRPVLCVTSTITGKCVPCFKIGTADISRVLRVAFS